MDLAKNLIKRGLPTGFYNDPVFIIGNPRSGTSLLRLMLTCHPHMVIPPEGHFFLWLEEKFGDLAFPEASGQFIEELFKTKKFEIWKVEQSSLQLLFNEYPPNTYREAVALVYCAYGILKGRTAFRYWGDKNKLWKEKLFRVIHYYPNAKFIHLVRDGRDVACSFKELSEKKMHLLKYGPNLPNNIETIAERWAANIVFIQKFLACLKADQQISIRYEDVILAPEQTLTDVTRFLRLDFSESMLDYARRNKQEKIEPEETMQWKLKLNSALDKRNIGKFAMMLTKEEHAFFNSRCKDILTYYGYK